MFQSSSIPAQKNKPAILSPLNKSAFFKPVIQPKLNINQPGDAYEQEADTVADKVLAQPVNDNAFFKPAIRQSANTTGLNIQRAPGNIIQRDPITGTKSTNAKYELDNNSPDLRQAKTTGTSAFADAKLAYDESSSKFSITFPLAWIFPQPWDNGKRDGYVTDFEHSVLTAWNDRFLLTESGTKRAAHVDIKFDEKVVHQMENDIKEATEFSSILSGRWAMDTRKTFVRANVNGLNVQLDQDANKNHTIKGSDVTSGASFVVHDGNENKTFTQNTSAHEFGHMIGLSDEYIDDNGTPLSRISAARAHVNNRIMNVGNQVTTDVYAPFADWLSSLTGTTWTVGRSVR